MYLLLAGPAGAHEVRPALVQIIQATPNRYDITWKRPILGDVALRLQPTLSSGWLTDRPQEQFAGAGYLVSRWSLNASEPLDGQTLAIEGLSDSLTDVLVEISTLDGRQIRAVITPAKPQLRLDLWHEPTPEAPAYLKMGITHILGGMDHLMFVLGMLLLVGPNRRLAIAITAFSVAHSLTLGASALEWVRAPTPVIEALVALSIVFVAFELSRGRNTTSLTQLHPWSIALGFGLLHGFAFAGALAEVGLPTRSALAALCFFNLGVEIGQLLFVGVALAMIWVLTKGLGGLGIVPAAIARRACAYIIGCSGAYWFMERLSAALA